MFNNREIFKYLLLGVIVYLLTKYLPKDVLGTYEKYRPVIIVIISILVILIFFKNNKESFSNENNASNIHEPQLTTTVVPATTVAPTTPTVAPTAITTVAPKRTLLEAGTRKQRNIALVDSQDISKLRQQLEETKKELNNIKDVNHNPENTKKYYNLLKVELFNKGMIDQDDVDLYDDKVKQGEPVQNIIEIFEKLSKKGTVKKIENIKKKLDVSSDNWEESQQFNIIHSDFWTLPQKRKPVCKGPTCKTCAYDDGLDGFSIGKPIQ
jgi:hypothetical protein